MEEIKQRYNFNNWIPKIDKMIKKYVLPTTKLVGLVIEKQAFYDYDSTKKIYEYILNGPDSIQIMVSVIECESIRSSQEHLLSILEAYYETVLEETNIGDKSYINGNSIIFIKSNFYVKVSSTGGNVIKVDEISKKIEESI